MQLNSLKKAPKLVEQVIPLNRRDFVTATPATAAIAAAPLCGDESSRLDLATNTYPWDTFAKRDSRTFPLHTDESLAAIAATGIGGYEPIITQLEEFDGLAACGTDRTCE